MLRLSYSRTQIYFGPVSLGASLPADPSLHWCLRDAALCSNAKG